MLIKKKINCRFNLPILSTGSINIFKLFSQTSRRNVSSSNFLALHMLIRITDINSFNKINFSHARRWTNKLLMFFPTVHFCDYMNSKKPEKFRSLWSLKNQEKNYICNAFRSEYIRYLMWKTKSNYYLLYSKKTIFCVYVAISTIPELMHITQNFPFNKKDIWLC